MVLCGLAPGSLTEFSLRDLFKQPIDDLEKELTGLYRTASGRRDRNDRAAPRSVTGHGTENTTGEDGLVHDLDCCPRDSRTRSQDQANQL
jgi:hypothetical protein